MRVRLKENLILAWALAPSHGGLFMLRPGPRRNIQPSPKLFSKPNQSVSLGGGKVRRSTKIRLVGVSVSIGAYI